MPHDIPGEQTASGHSATRRAHTLTNQTSQPHSCLPLCRPGAYSRDSGAFCSSLWLHHPSVPQAGSSSNLLSPSGGLALWLPMSQLQPAVHTTLSLPCWNSVAPSPGSMAPTTLRPGTGLSHVFQPLPSCPVSTTPYLEQDSLAALAVGHSD